MEIMLLSRDKEHKDTERQNSESNVKRFITQTKVQCITYKQDKRYSKLRSLPWKQA